MSTRRSRKKPKLRIPKGKRDLLKMVWAKRRDILNAMDEAPADIAHLVKRLMREADELLGSQTKLNKKSTASKVTSRMKRAEKALKPVKHKKSPKTVRKDAAERMGKKHERVDPDYWRFPDSTPDVKPKVRAPEAPPKKSKESAKSKAHGRLKEYKPGES